MKVYNHDNNGIYTHESIAEADPLEPSRIVLMLHQLEDRPPKSRDGFAIRRIGNAWEHVEDHVGKVVYDAVTGEEVMVKEYGPIDQYANTPKPTLLHVWLDGEWVISDEDQEKLNNEIEAAKKAAAMAEVKTLHDEANKELATLQYRVKYDRATPEHLSRLETLEMFVIDLDDWMYPSAVPYMCK